MTVLPDQLTAWQAAGLIDEATAARIAAYEAGRAPAPGPAPGSRINVGEVIAYAGSVVLLVGVGFLYGTQYAELGSAGRLALIGAVALGSLAAGEVVRRAGATEAAGRGARELLRFGAVVPPVVAALVLSQFDPSLEWFAGLLSAAALGAAVLRGSAGYAVGGGLALFLVVNEVGLRHFAQSVGYPVVLIGSGALLLAIAAGLFRLLPRLRRAR